MTRRDQNGNPPGAGVLGSPAYRPLCGRGNLLNTQEDMRFYQKIRPMLFAQKVEQFGEKFSSDYVKIMSCESAKEVKQLVDNVSDPQRKILIADTYFNIRRGAETLSKKRKIDS